MAISAAAALVAVVLLASARKPDDSAPVTLSAKEVRVQAALYSGLPNPKWTLQPSQVGECLKMLSELPASKNQEPQRGLGYSGLRLELIQTNGAIISFRIHDGGVWMEDNSSVAYSDKGQAFERRLIATAPSDVRRLIPLDSGN